MRKRKEGCVSKSRNKKEENTGGASRYKGWTNIRLPAVLKGGGGQKGSGVREGGKRGRRGWIADSGAASFWSNLSFLVRSKGKGGTSTPPPREVQNLNLPGEGKKKKTGGRGKKRNRRIEKGRSGHAFCGLSGGQCGSCCKGTDPGGGKGATGRVP